MGNNNIKTLISLVKKTNSHNYYKTMASLNILTNSNDVLDEYLNNEYNNKAKLILNIYGLLQNLFVYIDALYDLTKALLNNKHLININQNKELRKIKHIRNDIVGHPTYRTYSRGGVSYSFINFDKTTKTKIYYTSYYYNKNKEEVINEVVDVELLISSYKNESSIIIKEVINRLKHKVKTNIYLKAYDLAKNINSDNNLTLLKELKNNYIKSFNIINQSNDRICWRINLLNKAINLNNNKLIEIKEFIKLYQANKLYLMFLELENKSYQTINIKTPKTLSLLVKQIKDKNLVKCVYNLNDKSHFYFNKDVNELLLQTKNPLFNYLLEEDDYDLVYLVGSVIRNLVLK